MSGSPHDDEIEIAAVDAEVEPLDEDADVDLDIGPPARFQSTSVQTVGTPAKFEVIQAEARKKVDTDWRGRIAFVVTVGFVAALVLALALLASTSELTGDEVRTVFLIFAPMVSAMTAYYFTRR